VTTRNVDKRACAMLLQEVGMEATRRLEFAICMTSLYVTQGQEPLHIYSVSQSIVN
jgi:hypothetical protein